MTKVGTNWKSFTAGHRIPWHEKCGRMHGHTFQVRVIVDGQVDSSTGIVVDFGDLAKALNEIIDPLDHRFLAAKDAVQIHFSEEFVKQAGTFAGAIYPGGYYVIDKKYILPESDVVVLPLDIISSENLAKYILNRMTIYPWAAGKTITVQVKESGDNIAEDSMMVYDGRGAWLYQTSNWGTSTSGNITYITFPPYPTIV